MLVSVSKMVNLASVQLIGELNMQEIHKFDNGKSLK